MTAGVYRFQLRPDVPLEDAEMTLQLAILAAEGLFGGARVRMEAGYRVDEPQRALQVDASTEVGSAVVRIFTAFLTREFGETRFAVRHTEAPKNVGSEASCGHELSGVTVGAEVSS